MKNLSGDVSLVDEELVKFWYSSASGTRRTTN